ncbi:MAG: hypothetical protein HDR14_08920 [Lachnospiraceae bacterium]|nr:hypothetical protein [Lachnospiraceae bacterium]
MSGREEEFLAGVWKKAEEKEQAARAAKVLLSETAKPDFAGFMKDTFVNIGVKQLYAGMADVISIAFVITVLFVYLLVQVMLNKGESIYAAAFCSAPLLYAGIFALTWMKERGSGCYELQMSCKYTFFHVLAARMLGECFLGFVFNGMYAFALALRYQVDGIRLFAVSFSSLMLFSLLFAAGLLWGRGIRSALCCCGGWFLINFLFLFFIPAIYGRLLQELPVLLFIGVGVCGMCLHIRQLMSITAPSFRKEYTNAANTRCY